MSFKETLLRNGGFCGAITRAIELKKVTNDPRSALEIVYTPTPYVIAALEAGLKEGKELNKIVADYKKEMRRNNTPQHLWEIDVAAREVRRRQLDTGKKG